MKVECILKMCKSYSPSGRLSVNNNMMILPIYSAEFEEVAGRNALVFITNTKRYQQMTLERLEYDIAEQKNMCGLSILDNVYVRFADDDIRPVSSCTSQKNEDILFICGR